MKRDFLTVWDFSSKEIDIIINRAIELKEQKNTKSCPLIGKSIGLLFEKSSTRTRVSFEVGIYQLGAQPVYMNPGETQLGRGETIADTAKVLSRYLDGMIVRTYGHEKLEEYARYSTVPVINGLTDKHHPCQSLADLTAIKEKKGHLNGIKLAYIGDGNNVANSLIEASSRMQVHLTIACPEGFEPALDVLERARESARSEIIILRDPREAVGRADVIYTDVWASMGEEDIAEKKKMKLHEYQVTDKLLTCAKSDVIVLHCLPAHRGEEITASVMDGPNSAVFDQAENRLYAQKALLEMLIK